jgi:secondary thiamine-phosphate synthase enzyme
MVVNDTISFSTNGNNDIIDITDRIQSIVSERPVQNGTVTIFVPGSTAAITSIEYESGAISDLKRLLNELIPENREYQHNLAWGDGNAHAHLRASLIGPSLNIPFVNRSLLLGTWQQIIFIDCDNRPRSRSVTVQIVGE